jgi:DNA-directed RNA polymerase specialized sigma24 family protein
MPSASFSADTPHRGRRATWRGAARGRIGRRSPTDESAERDACPSLAELHHAHYRSLFRLAALLTGDPAAAEAVVLDSFAAMQHPGRPTCACDGGLFCLYRLVVARSRRAVRHGRPAGAGQAPAPPGMPAGAGGAQEAPRFGSDAMVLALRALPAGQREAIVLTLYLDLTDEQAAAAMRVSLTALRRHLAAARAALRAALPTDS